jgi:hypothetical protein
MAVLGPRAHGCVDYLTVAGFCAAPSLFGLEATPATIAYTLSGVHLVLTLATDFPLGIVRIVPFPLHGMIEFAVAIALLALPWVFGFSADQHARVFCIAASACVLAVFLLTDYRGSTRS